VAKPAAKAPVKKGPTSKTAKVIAKLSATIAKLSVRKDKIFAEIKAHRAQRAALKAAPAATAPVAPKAMAPSRAAAPKKAAKPAAKK